jgi:hypothetical protein
MGWRIIVPIGALEPVSMEAILTPPDGGVRVRTGGGDLITLRDQGMRRRRIVRFSGN